MTITDIANLGRRLQHAATACAMSPVVEFPTSDEERARRLRAEVERLAGLPPVEWMFYLSEGVAKKYGVERANLQKMIEATIKQREAKSAKPRSRTGSASATSRRRRSRLSASAIASRSAKNRAIGSESK
jgi:hypothetical protein